MKRDEMKGSSTSCDGSKSSIFRTICLVCVLLCHALLLVNCGGETRGTGGTRVVGIVLDDDGAPLAGVSVSTVSQSDADVSDSNGNFSLNAADEDVTPQGTLPITFARDGNSAAGAILNPGSGASVSVVARVNFQSMQANVTVVSVSTPTPAPTGTATPLPRPSASATSTPNPTAVPTIGPCPADFNHDGVLNQADAGAYEAAFQAGSPSADFDQDGFVTGDDFDGYLTAYNAGCS
jgi:hypothetical protein